MGIFGVSQERVESLREWFTSQIFDVRKQQALHYEAMTKYGLRIAQIEGREEATRKFHESQISELTSAVAKLSADLAEIDGNRKPLIEIVGTEQPAKRRNIKSRQSASVRRGWYIALCNQDEAVKAVWEQAQLKGVSMDAAALYEVTGGFRCHKGRMESSILRHTASGGRYGLLMIDRTRGESANGNDQTRSLKCETLAKREHIIQTELPTYHALWASRAYYSEKGRKP
jgi:hypothetical protein